MKKYMRLLTAFFLAVISMSYADDKCDICTVSNIENAPVEETDGEDLDESSDEIIIEEETDASEDQQ